MDVLQPTRDGIDRGVVRQTELNPTGHAATEPPESTWIASRSDDLIAALCGAWMVIGLFTDGWAHRNEKPETFFSPWHGLLYSGFLASSIWMLRVVRRGQGQGFSGRQAIPAGYGLRLIGVGLFGIGGMVDFAWHSIFGIEADIEALLSPPHLVLLSGGILMAIGPIVSSTAREMLVGGFTRTWRSTGAVIGTVTFVVLIIGFFLMYLSPFDYGIFSNRAYDAMEGNQWLENASTAKSIGGLIIFGLLSSAAMTWLARNLPVAVGGWLVLLLVPALAQSALTSFDFVGRSAGALLAGLFCELTWPRIAKRVGQPGFLAGWVALAATLQTCGVLLAVMVDGEGLNWSPELWSGTSILVGLLSGGMVLFNAPSVLADRA